VRLLTGRGSYTDDLSRENEAQMVILRSPHANARINSIDVAAAQAAPGVLMVLTGAEADADGLGLFPVMVEVPGKDGTRVFAPPRKILQAEHVRFVGDPVALLLAESRRAAEDAAEFVEGRYRIGEHLVESGEQKVADRVARQCAAAAESVLNDRGPQSAVRAVRCQGRQRHPQITRRYDVNLGPQTAR
jgi:CO/xanthine dehydrogenase Mo-binding subunit